MNVTFVFLSDPPIALLVLQGELDLSSRPGLVARLSELDDLEVDVLYLDMGHVSFVDCGCLHELERARRRLQAAGRRLELVAASPFFLKAAGYARYRELSALGPPAVPAQAPAAARWRAWPVEARYRLRTTLAAWLSGTSPKP